MKGLSLPTRLRGVVICVYCFCLQGFLAEGLQRTSAGLGSVIIDSQPLSVALLAALLFGEALSPLGVSGLFIGVAGLLLLELPQVRPWGVGGVASAIALAVKLACDEPSSRREANGRYPMASQYKWVC
jgi:drug/metabolite transporter (DMT)-like permease